MKRWVKKVYTSTSPVAFVAPAGVTCAFIRGVGGGGGGGAGCSTSSTVVAADGGGAGGGGAIESTWAIVLVPGRTYNVTAGTGGTGGTVSSGADGSNGSDSVVYDTVAAMDVARFIGARGGQGGILGHSRGGGPLRESTFLNNGYNSVEGLGGRGNYRTHGAATRALGGCGSNSGPGAQGGSNGLAGGLPAFTAGQGGGGGGGPGGTGGVGGDDGVNAGTGNGYAAANGTVPGSGGGGGGGAGRRLSAGTNGYGTGGAGANGLVTIEWLE